MPQQQVEPVRGPDARPVREPGEREVERWREFPPAHVARRHGSRGGPAAQVNSGDAAADAPPAGPVCLVRPAQLRRHPGPSGAGRRGPPVEQAGRDPGEDGGEHARRIVGVERAGPGGYGALGGDIHRDAPEPRIQLTPGRAERVRHHGQRPPGQEAEQHDLRPYPYPRGSRPAGQVIARQPAPQFGPARLMLPVPRVSALNVSHREPLSLTLRALGSPPGTAQASRRPLTGQPGPPSASHRT